MKLLYSTKKLVYYKFLFNQELIYNKDFKNLIIKYQNSIIYNSDITLTSERLINKSRQKIFTFNNLYIRSNLDNKIENINIIYKTDHRNKLYYYDFCNSDKNDDVIIKFL